jgi:hypothetical protein
MKKKKKPVRHNNIHHVLPRSRMGDNSPENLVEWDINFHAAYHHMFENMTLDEAITMLRIVSVGNTRWTKAKLRELRNVLMEEE